MKARNFLPLGALGLILASCSSDEPTQNGGIINPDGAAYLSVNIQLPATTGTRADDDKYQDGLPGEYDVDRAVVFMWVKPDGAQNEGDYEFVQAGTIETMKPASGSSADVTAKYVNKVFKFDNQIVDGKEYYATVILNGPGQMLTPEPGTKYRNWAWAETTADFIDSKGYFFMTNAAKHVDNRTVTTLEKIETSQLTTDEDEAVQKGAVLTVYVERGVAKVTVSSGSTNENKQVFEDKDSEYKGTATLSNWVIDHYASTSNRVSDSRAFAGMTGFWESDSKYEFNRMLFNASRNYTIDGRTLTSGKKNMSDNPMTFGDATPAYCKENTADLESMKKSKNLTRVVFKGKYTPKDMAEGTSFITYDNAAYTVSDFVTKVVAPKATALNMQMLDEYTLTAGDIDLSVFFAPGTDTEALVRELGTVAKYYEKGVCYYAVLIKHFDTGWESGPFADKDLGLFGVVRNNWYEVAVNGVNGPGQPTWPDDEDVTEVKYMLNTTVNVNKWAKHTQGETLK